MPADLPGGFTWRRAEHSDAPAILALLVELSTAAIGYCDYTLDAARDDLAEPGFTLSMDTWLVHDAAGNVAGYAWATGPGTGGQVDIDVLTQVPELYTWFYQRVLARAEELAGSEAFQGIYRQDARMSAVAAAHGFQPVTAFHRMRVEHDLAVKPIAPPGVTLRRGPGDERFLRSAHAVLNESFKDHHGWVARPFEQWHEGGELASVFDWSMLTVAELDSRPVAILVTTDRFVEAENCGYVGDLGVLAEARGRGIAKYLLRTAFAADIRAGRTGTILHVDTNNVTPAVALYESVGMRAVLVIDIWHRELA